MSGEVSTSRESELTFGIEFEFVLIFHEGLIEDYLPPGARLRKHLTRAQRRNMTDAGFDTMDNTRPYESWAITDNSEESDPTKNAYGYPWRMYEGEPLHIVGLLLSEAGYTTNVFVWPPEDKTPEIYRHWHVTNDRTLRGARRDKFIEFMDQVDYFCEIDDEWDSYGLELVSPVLRLADAANWERQVREVLAVLNGNWDTSLHTAMVTKDCGLHVHVGRVGGWDLKTIQHLVYTCLSFELFTDLMHPPSRHKEDWRAPALVKHLLEFGPDAQPTEPIHPDILEDLKIYYQGISVFHADVFAEDRTLENIWLELADRGKQYLVSTYSLSRAPPHPQTVEFRQHAGTINFEETRWWVLFVTGIVRLAEKCAANDTAFPPLDQRRTIPSLDMLLKAMDFPAEGRAFYRDRVNHYQTVGNGSDDAAESVIDSDEDDSEMTDFEDEETEEADGEGRQTPTQ